MRTCRHHLIALSAVTLLAACGGSTVATPRPAAAPAPASSPSPAPAAAIATPPPAIGFRLPAGTRPTAYRVTLTVDPAAQDIAGDGEIDVERSASGPLYLNATELTIARAIWRSAGTETPLAVAVVDNDMVALSPPAGAALTGPGTLVLRWTARLRREDTMGAFAQRTDDAWYAYTQFESLGARRVLPCFDEPAFKVPWQLTLRVPNGLVALSNTPVVAEADDGGLRRVEFAATPALPSYLLAFAVGPFEMLDAGTSTGGAPIRVAVPRGHGDEAKFPVEDTKPLLDRLEAYFGTPYPFAKLDLVPIPDTVGFGAMENPGLITYVSSLLLQKPVDRDVWDRRAYASTAAHEMAHQWFGNLVTMAWWDDTWLNEAFASWMGDKVLHGWQPDWDTDLSTIGRKGRIVALDGRASTRRIREPVTDANGVSDAFDGITYSKGQQVLAMLEAWVGEDVFRDGVRGYLAAHARGNATYADFAAAIARAAGHDVRGVSDGFIEQNGAPLVRMALVCARGTTPRVTLAQERYAPIGAALEGERRWQIPVSVAWTAGRAKGIATTVLRETTGELVLDGATACPDRLVPDPDGVGYYVWAGQGRGFDRLIEPKVLRGLPARARMNIAVTAKAMLAADGVPFATLLQLAAALIDDPERQVRSQLVSLAAGLNEWVPPALVPVYRGWVRATFAHAIKTLGFAPRAGEADDDRAFRSTVIERLAYDGEAPAVIAESTRLARAWLDDHHAVAPDLAASVLGVAAYFGDAALYDRVLADARKAHATGDKPERARLLGVLASFRGEALEARTRAFLLSDEFPIFELYRFMGVGVASPEGRERNLAFLMANYDAIVARLPSERRGDMIRYTGDCTAPTLARVEAFFAERTPKELGGPRTFASHVESQTQCIARRARYTPSIVAYFARRR